MKNMIWPQDTMSYRGECRDGAVVNVTGDEWSESVADGINALIDDRKINREKLTHEQDEELINQLRNEVEKELDDPDWWAALAGDNPNVEMIGE